MTSNHHAPYVLGYTRNTWRLTEEAKPRGGADPQRRLGVRIARLQLACVKSGIASNRGSACRGEYVPGPCTHRPSHHGAGTPKSVV